jgi:hypothetical protein
MKTFPALFRNHAGGLKSGMLGRWQAQYLRSNHEWVCPCGGLTLHDFTLL